MPLSLAHVLSPEICVRPIPFPHLPSLKVLVAGSSSPCSSLLLQPRAAFLSNLDECKAPFWRKKPPRAPGALLVWAPKCSSYSHLQRVSCSCNNTAGAENWCAADRHTEASPPSAKLENDGTKLPQRAERALCVTLSLGASVPRFSCLALSTTLCLYFPCSSLLAFPLVKFNRDTFFSAATERSSNLGAPPAGGTQSVEPPTANSSAAARAGGHDSSLCNYRVFHLVFLFHPVCV